MLVVELNNSNELFKLKFFHLHLFLNTIYISLSMKSSTAFSPYCVPVTLSSKPATNVLVIGGISGELSISPPSGGETKLRTINHTLNSPITALIAIDDSPLVVAGTYDGCIHCIYINRIIDSDVEEALSVVTLLQLHVSSKEITQICYQPSTKKLAFVTSINDNCQLTVACLEPNNMKVIGAFNAPLGVSSLAWGHDEYQLFVAHDNSISCHNVIEMTFEDDGGAECLWTKTCTGITNFHQMIIDDTGHMVYAINRMRRGVYSIGLVSSEDSKDELSIMHYGDDVISSSASSCLLIDDEHIIVGSISGEISMCQASAKDSWKTLVDKHSCAVTSLFFDNDGFMSVGLDGCRLAHNKQGRERSIVPSSTNWDYLVSDEIYLQYIFSCNIKSSPFFNTQLQLNLDSATITDVSDYNANHGVLYREEYICPMEETNYDESKIQLLHTNDIIAIKTYMFSNDILYLYPLNADLVASHPDTGAKHRLQSLFDVQNLQVHLQNEFKQGWTGDKIFVETVMGELGLISLNESDAFIVVDSNVISTKRREIAGFRKEIFELSVCLFWLDSYFYVSTLLLIYPSKLLQRIKYSNFHQN